MQGNAVLLLLVGALSWLAGWQGALAEVLSYERAAILQGQWWRLLTGHLVHGSALHWAMNLLGLALVFGLFERHERVIVTLLYLIFLALVISAGLLILHPELIRYVGMSGVVHGLFACYAARTFLSGRRMAAIALLLLLAKLTTEQLAGPGAGTQALVGLPVIVDAHLYGAVAGMSLSLLWYATSRRARDSG